MTHVISNEMQSAMTDTDADRRNAQAVLEQLERQASIARSRPLSVAKRRRAARAARKAWRERNANR